MTPAIKTLEKAGVAFETASYEHDPRRPAYGEEAAEAPPLGAPVDADLETLQARYDVVGAARPFARRDFRKRAKAVEPRPTRRPRSEPKGPSALELRLTGVLGGGDTASLASWLGANVQAVGPVFFDGSPVALTTTPAPEATDAALIVRNAAGEIIARQPVSGLDAELIWNGLTAAGDPAPNGPYSFTVESSRNGEPLVTQQAVGFSKVEEIRLDGEDPVLVLQGGDSIGLDDVLAVR